MATSTKLRISRRSKKKQEDSRTGGRKKSFTLDQRKQRIWDSKSDEFVKARNGKGTRSPDPRTNITTANYASSEVSIIPLSYPFTKRYSFRINSVNPTFVQVKMRFQIIKAASKPDKEQTEEPAAQSAKLRNKIQSSNPVSRSFRADCMIGEAQPGIWSRGDKPSAINDLVESNFFDWPGRYD
jgi:hypothetical protein